MPAKSVSSKSPKSARSDADPFRLLFKNHPLPMWIYDLKTLAFLEVNDAAVEQYGYTRREFLKMTLKDIRPAEDVERLLEDVKRKRPALQHSGEWRHRRKDGSLIDVEITSHTLEYRGRKATLVTAQDVTARKQAENTLRENNQFVNSLLRAIPVAVFFKDKDGKYIGCNDVFTEIMGTSAEEIRGKTVYELWPSELAQVYHEKDLELMRNRQHQVYEFQVKDKNGHIRPVIYAKDVFLDANGNPVGMVGAFLDITERKQAMQRIEQHTHELEALQATILDIASPRSLPDLLYIIVARACKLLGTSSGGLYLCDAARQEVRCVVSYNTPRDYTGTILKYGEGAAGRVGLTGEPLMIENYQTWSGRAETFGPGQSFERVMSVPLKWEGRVTGVIHALRAGGAPFNKDDLELLGMFANHASLAVEQARLREALEQELAERGQIEERLREREMRYRNLFEDSPASLWEEDFSAVKQRLDALRAEGVDDFRSYFESHPQVVAECASLVKVLDVNKATLKMQGAAHKEELLTNLAQIFGDQFLHEFRGELLKIANGQTTFDWEGTNQTLSGETLIVNMRWSAAPGHEQSLDRVIISLVDVTERRRAEKQLQESENRYRDLVERTSAVIYNDAVNDCSSSIYMSPSIEDLLGYTAEEWQADPAMWTRLLHPDDRERVLEQHLRTNETGEPFKAEYRLIHRDGSAVWVSDDATLLRDEAGKPLYWQGVLLDITERKQAEEAQRAAEASYRAMVEQIPAITYVDAADGSGFSTFVSPQIESLFGIRQEEWMRMDARQWSEMIHPEDRTRVLTSYQRTMKTGPSFNEEYRLTLRDGRVVWIEDHAVRLKDAGGRPTALHGVMFDITERKRAEEALKESETKYRAQFEASTDAIFVETLEGKILDCNEAACRMLGYDKTELTALTVADLVPAEVAKMLPGLITEEATTGGFFIEASNKRKNGQVFPCEVSTRIVTLGGEPRVIAYVRDITERKRAENAIRTLNAELEGRIEERTRELRETQEQLVRQEKLAVMGQLAGGVGHELRNPLAVISNAVYFLKLIQPQADEKVREYLGMIERETHTAEKIITDLLDFARVKSVEREAVSVSTLVDSVLARFPAPSGVAISLEIPPGLPKVYADPRHMEQVLGNLVVNACQAMKEGGQLSVISDQYSVESGQWVRIAVRDTGVGIPPENMKKLFEPLFTTKVKGIGLGLAVSRKLAEANGGRIEVQSEPGEGSTFTLHIPAWMEAT